MFVLSTQNSLLAQRSTLIIGSIFNSASWWSDEFLLLFRNLVRFSILRLRWTVSRVEVLEGKIGCKTTVRSVKLDINRNIVVRLHKEWVSSVMIFC